MPFNQHNEHIRPHVWVADRNNGISIDAVRSDEDADDISAALTELRQLIAGLNVGTLNPALYYVRSQIDAFLQGKQNALGFTPIDTATRGQAGGVATLDVSGKVPASQLPASAGASAGVASFNGREGAVGLQATDVTAALGFVPSSETHTHTIAQVANLQAALDAKQPANVMPTHGHQISEIDGLTNALNGKQSQLNYTPAGVSSSSAPLETAFPVGQILFVNITGTAPDKGASVVISTGLTNNDSYNTAGAGTALAGVWRNRGVIGTTMMAQKVS